MEKSTFTTNNLPKSEQPYEKFKSFGAKSLSDAELLAIILKCGSDKMNSVTMSQHILSLAGDNGIVGIANLSMNKLMKIHGIGEIKAMTLLCIDELAKRYAKGYKKPLLDFSNPHSIAEYYMQDMRNLTKEHLILVMLDTKNRMIGDSIISIGTVNSSLISPREIYITALLKEAVRIILLHNHPSGDPTPSKEDILTTKEVYSAGEILGITLLDHIIIGDNCYISLMEENLM